MLNNDDSNTNGELFFYNTIKNNINTVFDVGCRSDSLFKNFLGDVHYFDPSVEAIEKLKSEPNSNKNSYYNNFGLSHNNKIIFYYPKYQSVYNRIESCKIDDNENKKSIQVIAGYDYVKDNNIEKIDFLKIDVEGHEFFVIKGFKDYISNVDIIQFEYGETYVDSGVSLADIKNYLNGMFNDFYYLSFNKIIHIKNFEDHYNYCNIVCFNNNYEIKKYKNIIYA